MRRQGAGLARAAMIQLRVRKVLERPSWLDDGAPASDRATSVPAGTSRGSMPIVSMEQSQGMRAEGIREELEQWFMESLRRRPAPKA
jgi:hypothetical protein